MSETACRNRENYIHRIGRSGRFGRKGVAINVCSPLSAFAQALTRTDDFTVRNGG